MADVESRGMKTTRYFERVRTRQDRKDIRDHWIMSVVNDPIQEAIEILETRHGQEKRIRRWGYIPEADKYLRVVLLEDEETVHNAFFDRNFKP